MEAIFCKFKFKKDVKDTLSEEQMVDILTRYNVKTKNNRYCSLLVKKEHAELFFKKPESERKVYEIRKTPVHFLQEGEAIAIVATGYCRARFLLGIVEYQGCVKIKKAHFSRFFSLHRVCEEAFQDLCKSWGEGEYVYGWHFEVVYQFQPPVFARSIAGPEVWFYFWIKDLPELRPSQERIQNVKRLIFCLPYLLKISVQK